MVVLSLPSLLPGPGSPGQENAGHSTAVMVSNVSFLVHRGGFTGHELLNLFHKHSQPFQGEFRRMEIFNDLALLFLKAGGHRGNLCGDPQRECLHSATVTVNHVSGSDTHPANVHGLAKVNNVGVSV